MTTNIVCIETQNVKFFELCREILTKKQGCPATDSEVLNYCLNEFAKQGSDFFNNTLQKDCENHTKIQSEYEAIFAENKVLETNLAAVLQKLKKVVDFLYTVKDKTKHFHERFAVGKTYDIYREISILKNN